MKIKLLAVILTVVCCAFLLVSKNSILSESLKNQLLLNTTRKNISLFKDKSVHETKNKNTVNFVEISPQTQISQSTQTLQKDRRWRKNSGLFDNYFDLASKAVISNTDQDRLMEILSEGKYLKIALSVLTTFDTTKNDWLEERKRLESIAYLTDVLSSIDQQSDQWMKAKNIALQVYQQSVNFSWNEDLIKALIGDKVEIGVLLKSFAPNDWNSIKSKSQGRFEVKLIANIDHYRNYEYLGSQ